MTAQAGDVLRVENGCPRCRRLDHELVAFTSYGVLVRCLGCGVRWLAPRSGWGVTITSPEGRWA